MDLLNNLNEMQKKAVLQTEGPVMVMAGAGSGKTRVLTHRIAHLIDLGIAPSSILAVTFTNKAAREMKERVEKLTGINTRYMWVSTFHSFCAKFLRIEMKGFYGYTNDFIIIDEDDSVKIIREILKEFKLDIKEYKPALIKSYISKEKNREGVTFKDPDFERVYNSCKNRYNERLLKENLLDFDDLITITIELLKDRPETLEKYQYKFQYIMVDEFQDTNIVQYELMKMLAFRHKNIFVVGDQDQSIYSFRGAKIENIDHFLRDFLGTETILLEENYRSTNAILKLANKVIDNNENRIKKNLYTNNKADNKPIYYRASSSFDEVMYVVDKIKEFKRIGYKYSDFAILYRMNSLSRQFEDIFLRYQIPYVIYGGLSFFERKEIKDMVAYLRLILNHDDDFSFRRIVNEPKRKIGNAIIDRLVEIQNINNISLFDSIDHFKATGIGYNNLLTFKETIIKLGEYLNDESEPLEKMIDHILDKTGYLKMLQAEEDEGEVRLDNVRELKTVLKEAFEFHEKSKPYALQQLLSDLALRTDVDNKNEEDDCVKLMTYHQSKGLEYRFVFMVALEQGIFPSANCFSYKELEEERRICYVGITRAKERLYLTNASSRYLYGSFSNQAPSCYIKEMGYDNMHIVGQLPKKELDDLFTPSKPKPVEVKEPTQTLSLNVGDKISHKAFGEGTVVQKNGQIVTVAFGAPYGVKKLMESHPSIRKI